MDGIKKSRNQLRLREEKRKREEADFLRMQEDDGGVIVSFWPPNDASRLGGDERGSVSRQKNLMHLLMKVDVGIACHFRGANNLCCEFNHQRKEAKPEGRSSNIASSMLSSIWLV